MFDAQDAPQPPKVLTTPLEIASNLRMLQESHDPLIITFQDRTQRFQSYVVDVNRESSSMALDEMIPVTVSVFLKRVCRSRLKAFMMVCALPGNAPRH